MTRDRVGAGIDQLEDHFDSFAINQSTHTVPTRAYQETRERADDGLLDVYVRVRNEDGDVLHVRGDGDLSIPRCVEEPTDTLERCIRNSVREATGVDCVIDDVSRVTIAGVHDEDDPDGSTVYRLVVLLEAAHEHGTPDDGVWQPDDATIPEYV